MALSDNLQGWWCPSLDTAGNGTTTLTDLSGNGNDGTLTNMDAATDWVADTDNGGVRALDFDGINDRIAAFSDGAVNRVIEGSTWTVSFWSKPSAVAIALSFSDISTTSRWTGFYPTNGGKIQLNRLGGSGGSQIFQSATSPVVTDDWALFTYCFSASGLVIYHNGTQLTTSMFLGANTGSTYTSGQLDTMNMSAQERSSGVSTYLDHCLDGVAIWDRALTADEVTQLYNGGRSLNLLTDGIITTIPRFSTNNLSIGYDPLNGNFIL